LARCVERYPVSGFRLCYDRRMRNQAGINAARSEGRKFLYVLRDSRPGKRRTFGSYGSNSRTCTGTGLHVRHAVVLTSSAATRGNSNFGVRGEERQHQQEAEDMCQKNGNDPPHLPLSVAQMGTRTAGRGVCECCGTRRRAEGRPATTRPRCGSDLYPTAVFDGAAGLTANAGS
jgi:hypothetical protein